MRIAIYTLGCKVNQYETQALETELLRRGHALVGFEESVDAYVVNTCTVTAVSDKKSRSIIRRAQKLNPSAVVAVCGCYAQTDPQAVAALGVDLVMGTTDRMAFLDRVEEIYAEGHPQSGYAPSGAEPDGSHLRQVINENKGVPGNRVTVFGVDNIMTHRDFERLPAGGMEGRTRAMLKVEDGCVNFCSYCIIPYARGPVRSLPLSDAVGEAKCLAGAGYREIVLTGIEISSWAQDFRDGTSLVDLVEALCSNLPDLRVRLGSLEPRTITEDFCRRAAVLPNLCPHFHLSMQSGCDSVLKRMNRKYDAARYYESVKLLREYFSDPAITTDLIVGFPGECEEEFAETLAFVEKCAFSSMHIFPYSRRTGTPADKMEGQVPNMVKEERARRAGELAARLEREYLTRRIGETIPVLFEEEKGAYYPQGARPIRKAAEPPTAALWRGHAPSYVAVYATGIDLHNVLKDVKITGIHASGLLGELL